MAESKVKDSAVNFQRNTGIQGNGTMPRLALFKAYVA